MCLDPCGSLVNDTSRKRPLSLCILGGRLREVRRYDDDIWGGGGLDDIHHFPLTLRMLHKGCYFHRLSDLVLAFSCGLAKTFQIYTLSVDTYFSGNGEKNSVFKNIRYRLLTVRVDRA